MDYRSPHNKLQSDSGSGESSPGIRFITGFVLTIAVVAISAGTAFWFGSYILQLIPGNFFGSVLSVWLGAGVLFSLNFILPKLERAIVRDFEEMMLILTPTERAQ